MFKKIKITDLLQLFAEGGDGTGESPAAEGQTGEAPAAAGQEETAEEAFARFIDRYGEDAKPLKDHHQKNFGKRYAALKETEQQAKRLSEFRDVVAKRYSSVNADDIDALEDAFLSDTHYYEQRALAEGKDAKSIADNEKLQLKVSRLEAKQKAETEQKEIAAKAKTFRENLVKQEKAMQKAYPDFDLNKEMQNPKMQQLLMKDIPLEDAYLMIHHKDIVAKAVTDAKSATVQSIASKGTRAAEGAAASTVPSTSKVDYTKMSDKDFMEMYNKMFRN